MPTPPGQLTTQTPGGFVLFWNFVVPLTVLLNIQKFGIRTHELGLIVALLINPHLLGWIVYYPFIAWINTIFLIMWIERILRRWAWYRIYTLSFLKRLAVFGLFLAVPGVIMTYIWLPIYDVLPYVIMFLTNCENKDLLSLYRDALLLLVAFVLLLHSIYFYNYYYGCIPYHGCKAFCPRPNACKKKTATCCESASSQSDECSDDYY
ncbi:uncharacterized protein LOC131946034 [Physella acuta]|uniref:uncharacterized protein LOC131946034 n=1 Tax=Physella acuta TaxID=109671 RepID=UPI0027DDD54A|nr:uncharacterized protein LOC131946034 [Physella acuta]